MPIVEKEPTDYELSPLAEVLARQFIQRWDCYAQQNQDGTAYYTQYEQLNVEHLFAHLRGEITMGTYLLNEKSHGRFLVLDADDLYQWQQLVELAQSLQMQETTTYLEQSRRGGHLWLFLDRWQPGKQVRLFGKGLLAAHGIENVELYPKQDHLKKGPGSLVRLPFGIHRKDGRRYGFVTTEGQLLAPSIREQMRLLSRPQAVPKTVFQSFVEIGLEIETKNRKQVISQPQNIVLDLDGERPLSEQIKAAVSVRDFVGQFVELSETGMGLCPFHDDHHPSFSVNDEENYWHCFTCGIGGSVIDFWMQWQGCDFQTAVQELRQKYS